MLIVTLIVIYLPILLISRIVTNTYGVKFTRLTENNKFVPNKDKRYGFIWPGIWDLEEGMKVFPLLISL